MLSLGILSCLIFGAAGCQGNGLETKAPDMVELSTWIFTSGVPNNLITVKSEDEILPLDAAPTRGIFYTNRNIIKKLLCRRARRFTGLFPTPNGYIKTFPSTMWISS